MAAGRRGRLNEQDAIKTYRYLRIGLIGAVVLLAVSIGIERSKVNCWQTSISAYYYTPVRAIFVGVMIVVGLSLIVYKGRTWYEDGFLNAAGMLAPVVAIAPTTDVGRCWSVRPIPLPIQPDGSLAGWVVDNIDNNFYALLIAGAIGLGVAVLIAVGSERGDVGATIATLKVERGTTISLGLTALALLAGWLLIQYWDDFDTRAHGFAAFLMFIFLILAIIAKVLDHIHLQEWKRRKRRFLNYTATYALIAFLMAVGGTVILTTRFAGDHTTFVLEAYEIVLFAVYWIAQTTENWDQELIETTPHVNDVP